MTPRMSAGAWRKIALGGRLKLRTEAFAMHSWRWQRHGAASACNQLRTYKEILQKILDASQLAIMMWPCPIQLPR
jgi:hypothetical protein